MNLETIQSMWETDSQIDQFKIHDEAAKIPMLHAKYWDVTLGSGNSTRV